MVALVQLNRNIFFHSDMSQLQEKLQKEYEEMVSLFTASAVRIVGVSHDGKSFVDGGEPS